MSSYPNSIPRCEHIKINGTQCGSPALRRNHFCFFHKRWHETRIVLNANRARRGRAALDLPVLEDANSVQVSLMQVMRLVLSGQVDPKTAGLLLYALQTASSNLSRINFEPVETRVVIDPRTVDQTPLGEDPWCREDFAEEEYEAEDQDEAGEQVEAKSQDFGEDKEWTAEVTIPKIEGVAAPAPRRRQRAQVPSPSHGIALVVPRLLRNRARRKPEKRSCRSDASCSAREHNHFGVTLQQSPGSYPRSGARMQPTAQAVGRKRETEKPQRGER